MTGTIAYRSEKKVARLHDPRHSFALTTVESEIRRDPLTGASSRICHFSLRTAPPLDLPAILEHSGARCPFCPGGLMTVTPRFPEDLLPGGRLLRGDAVVVPNLFPYDDLSAITVMGAEHFLAMDDMPVRAICDGLTAARDFARIACGQPPFAGRRLHPLVTWNYMPPAGASQVHPHLQVVLTADPGNRLRGELEAESTYLKRHGRPYMADLVAEEKRGGSRWIGRHGSVSWFVPFAPIGVLGDCCAVFPGRASITELSDADIAAFAEGLARVLAGFAGIGLWSFNLSLLSDAAAEESGRHWLHARLVPRLYLNPKLHVTDVAHMQLLLEERFAMVFPEETAERLREACRFSL